MRTIRHTGWLGVWAMLAGVTHAACVTPDAALVGIPTETLPGYVEQRFATGDHDCAIRAVALKARALGGMNDPVGFHERFVLRNLALSASAAPNTPAARRLALLKAAATTLPSTSPTRSDPAERKYDTMLLLRAGTNFLRQREAVAQVEALTVALQIDQLQAAPARLTGSYDATSLVPESLNGVLLGPLTTLAVLARGDAVAGPLRRQIADRLYSNLSVRNPAGGGGPTAATCAAVVRLRDALADVQTVRGGQIPGGWSWRPTLEASWCYRDAAQPAESQALLEDAMGRARRIRDGDYRLSAQNELISALLAMKRDRVEILKLANEMLATAKATDTPRAREVRARVQPLADRLDYP